MKMVLFMQLCFHYSAKQHIFDLFSAIYVIYCII